MQKEDRETGPRERINRGSREIRGEIDGLPPLEMGAIGKYAQEAKSFEGLDNAMKGIVENQGKKMNSPQKERLELVVESQINRMGKKPSPIIPIGAKTRLKFSKGEVVGHSRPRVRIKWEDGTADWVHGGTTHKYYSCWDRLLRS